MGQSQQVQTKVKKKRLQVRSSARRRRRRGGDSGNFSEQCTEWVAGQGPKPSTCDGDDLDGCYKGALPISAVDGAWCVDDQISTCANYCNASGECPSHFCEECSSLFCEYTFRDQCTEWKAGQGPKPSNCAEDEVDGCNKGALPASAADSAYCVYGQMISCEDFCQTQ